MNCLEGKNISVVGLPNVDEKVYKLYGMMIGANIENEDMKNRKVQFEGCEFFMNTFGNYQLREIQLWILKSYLEQAVGRARLLRFNCTVKVFARFPVEQYKLM